MAQEIIDLRQDAESISEGLPTLSDMLSTPTSMFGRQLAYTNGASAYAKWDSERQFNALIQNPTYRDMIFKDTNNNAQLMAQRAEAAKKYLANNSIKQFSKQEARLLHEKVKSAELKKKRWETSLAEIEKAIQKYEKWEQESREQLFGGGNKQG